MVGALSAGFLTQNGSDRQHEMNQNGNGDGKDGMREAPAEFDPTEEGDVSADENDRIRLLISAAIARNGLKQGRVAESIGISPTSLNRKLNGHRRFSLVEFKKLKALLGITEKEPTASNENARRAVWARQRFAERLRIRRTALGLSTEDVTFGVITEDEYNELENAVRDPTLFELGFIAPRLRVSITWLVEGVILEGDPI